MFEGLRDFSGLLAILWIPGLLIGVHHPVGLALSLVGAVSLTVSGITGLAAALRRRRESRS